MIKQLVRAIIYFSKPILTGAAVALPLFALLWQQVGSLYAQGYPADSYQMMLIGMMFSRELLLPTLMIAFIAGMAAGSMSTKESELDAAALGGAAAAVFAVFIVMPTVMAVSGRGESLSASVSPVWVVPLLIFFFLFMSCFALLGSLQFIGTAVVGGACGRRLMMWRRWSFYSLIAMLSVIIMIFSIYYGSVTRSVLRAFQPEMRLIQSEVNRNLVDTSGDWTWRARFSRRIPPKIEKTTCDSKKGLVSVELSPDKRFKSAHLTVWMPRSASSVPHGKEEAAKMLRNYGVREPLLRVLQEDRGTWRAEQGKFSVVLSINYD